MAKKKKEVGIFMTGELLWKYRAVDAEMRNAELQRRHMEIEMDTCVGVCGDPSLQKLWNLLKNSKNDILTRQQALKDVQAQIEKELNVSLKNTAINDETGEVFLLDTSEKKGNNIADK